MYTDSTELQHKKLAKANIRLALLLGGVVLLAFYVTFSFWLNPQIP